MERNKRGAPQIKICGLTSPKEAIYLNEIHAAYAGFVFWEKSKRNVSFAQAREIYRYLDSRIKRVAVTVSPNLELLNRIEREGFDILQVHGELRGEVIRQCGIKIWRACNIEEPQDIKKLEELEKITGYVIDAKTAGSGKTFDWKRVCKVVEEMKDTVCAGKTFILAGGLNAKNIAEAVKIFEPDVVDVSSGVEEDHGKKRELVMEFARAVERINSDRQQER